VTVWHFFFTLEYRLKIAVNLTPSKHYKSFSEHHLSIINHSQNIFLLSLIQLFGDVWILDTNDWIWQELEVKNRQWEAPQLWCHPAVRIKDTVVVFSVPRHQGHVLSPEGPKGMGQQRPRLDGLIPMQTFILDCSQIRSHFSCSWKSPPIMQGSSPATSLHSVVVARGEILIFGGMFTKWSDSSPELTTANLVAISSNSSE